MKKFILTFLSFTCAALAGAQSISPQVIAAAGTHFTGSNAQLSWTVGEPIIATVSDGSNIITQGFHQTLLIGVAVEQHNNAGITVKVYPNPASDRVNISLINNEQDLQAELFDMTGKLLQARKISASENIVSINISGYARANYLLRIYAADQSLNCTYKIEKMNAY